MEDFLANQIKGQELNAHDNYNHKVLKIMYFVVLTDDELFHRSFNTMYKIPKSQQV